MRRWGARKPDDEAGPAQDPTAQPIFALRAINVRGRDFHPGDELPQPPGLVERGLATTDPLEAARLREITAVQRERREVKRRADELDARLSELRGDAGPRRAGG